MPHKLFSSCWASRLALAVTLFTSTVGWPTLEVFSPGCAFWVTEMREKIVTRIPLESLWTDERPLDASRQRYLTANDLTEMLKIHPVEFIVADVGAPLKRIPVDKCYEFWKGEVKRHLLSPHGKIDLSQSPDEYGYLASEWSGQIEVPIVLLEKIH